VEKIATGEQSGTWGSTTNTNLDLIDEAIDGVASVALSTTSYTMTTADGATSDGRHKVIKFTGSPGGTCTVTIGPNDMQKVYIIRNTSDQIVTLTQGSGGNVSVASGSSALVHCDGAGASAAVIDINTTPADDSVTAAKIAADAVGSSEIAADAVGSSEIAADAVGSSEIAANAVGSSELADDAVDTAAIADNAVTLAKMAHGTDGNLITYDTTGAPANVATGSSGQLLTSNGAGAAPTFQTAASVVADAVYPVGAIFTTVTAYADSAAVVSAIGGTTWVAFGAGKVLVGVDTGDSDFDTVEETGGAKTHTLTTAEMPAHTHNGNNDNTGGADNPGGDPRTLKQSGSDNTGSTGGGGAHNNVQPYITVYMWKRTV